LAAFLTNEVRQQSMAAPATGIRRPEPKLDLFQVFSQRKQEEASPLAFPPLQYEDPGGGLTPRDLRAPCLPPSVHSARSQIVLGVGAIATARWNSPTSCKRSPGRGWVFFSGGCGRLGICVDGYRIAALTGRRTYSRIANLVIGVFMVLGGIAKFFNANL
jgi:hypothetical protein